MLQSIANAKTFYNNMMKSFVFRRERERDMEKEKTTNIRVCFLTELNFTLWIFYWFFSNKWFCVAIRIFALLIDVALAEKNALFLLVRICRFNSSRTQFVPFRHKDARRDDFSKLSRKHSRVPSIFYFT